MHYQFIEVSGNADCGMGTSKSLRDFGRGWSLEDCQYNCYKTEGCTDMVWAKDSGHCNTFDGCDKAGENNGWQHYMLKGIFNSCLPWDL